jgi:type IV secretion system protein VirD4
VKVFDPTTATGFASSSWSPLRAANTVTGAQKAARALADAAPQGGAENLNFFLALARQLLWPILYAAAVGDRTMSDVVRWVLTQDRPADDHQRGEVFAILDEELAGADTARRTGAANALTAINAVWQLDERTRGSTYATCQTMIEPWQDPEVAATATGCDIDLAWLLAGNNTLYICAPTHEQQRLATVFGGLLGDLVQQAYDQANRSGTPLPPTLLVLDEAGNTPTRWLPSVASTCSGIGLQLVTVWQSKAQIDSAYGRLADSVITNHGTKIIFAGVSDPSTLDFAAHLLGEEEVLHRAISTEVTGGRMRVDESARSVPLVPVDALRRMRPGNALLLHGTLRPAHLRSRPYWRDPRLLELTGHRR